MPDEQPKKDDVQPVNPFTEGKEGASESSAAPIEGEVVESPQSNNAGGDAANEPISDAGVPDQVPLDEFDESFWDILEQAGISKSRFFLILFVILVVIIALVYFIFGLGGDGDGGEEEPEEEPPTEEEVVDESYSVAGLDSVTILGFEYSDEGVLREVSDLVVLGTGGSTVGLMSNLVIGQQFDSERADLVYYLRVLDEMQNVYNTNVYDLLDQSTDRRDTLEEFVGETYDLLQEAEGNFARINDQLDVLEDDYQLILDDQQAYEDAFFAALDNLAGRTSYDNLELFVESGQLAFEVRSLFNAYSTVFEMYKNALDTLWPRYDDMVFNQDALIEGIRVFDIPDSDIEVIIYLD